MDKIIPSLIQGSPTAVVVAIVYFLFVQPMSTRLDKVVDVMNREVIPIVNELKKKPLPGPEIKPLVELIENQRAKTEQVHRLVAQALERQEVSQEDLKKKLNGIQARLDENKKLALSAAVSPNFSKDPRKTFSKGEVVSWAYAPAEGLAFVVTDPQTLNDAKMHFLRSFSELGLKPAPEPVPPR